MRLPIPLARWGALTVFFLAACGGKAEPLSLTDLEGRPVEVLAPGVPATCWIFVAPDCPISNAFAPEVKRIVTDYERRGVRFGLVYSDPAFDAADAREHTARFDYGAPPYLDTTGAFRRTTGATVTPEAVVLDPEGEVLYRGRIDDRFVDFGKQRAAPTTRDLRAALDAVLAGRRPEPRFTQAIGCFLPDS